MNAKLEFPIAAPQKPTLPTHCSPMNQHLLPSQHTCSITIKSSTIAMFKAR